MNLPYKATPMRGELELLPLINIVFLLLIFFMLAGIVSVSGADRIDPPTSNAEQSVNGRLGQLSIAADGGLQFDAQPQTIDTVGPTVARWAAAYPQRAVILRADAQVDAGELVRVMTALRAAGVPRVRLLTRTPPPG